MSHNLQNGALSCKCKGDKIFSEHKCVSPTNCLYKLERLSDDKLRCEKNLCNEDLCLDCNQNK